MNFLPVPMSHGISHITGMVLSLQKNGNTASIQAYTLLMLFEPLSRVRRLMQLFCSKVTGKQYQDNAIRLFARFVGGGAKRQMTFQTTPVLCFAYVSRRTKSKRG